MGYVVYLLRCADGSLYTGITTDPARRFAEHAGQGGRGAKYTAAHRPIRIEAAFRAPDRAAASRLESRIKRLTHAQKERLLRDEPVLDGQRLTRAAADGEGEAIL